jgi:hypothetical protein
MVATMKDKPGSTPLTLKMEQAREMMARGHSQEALVLALDALTHALSHLKDNLLDLQNNLLRLQGRGPSTSPPGIEEPPTEPGAELEKRTRTYH